jgi:hypothetical protein
MPDEYVLCVVHSWACVCFLMCGVSFVCVCVCVCGSRMQNSRTAELAVLVSKSKSIVNPSDSDQIETTMQEWDPKKHKMVNLASHKLDTIMRDMKGIDSR